jgi:predicted acylesterase/phospholipase RssA
LKLRGKVSLVLVAVILALSGWLYFIKGYTSIRARHAVPEDLMSEAAIPPMNGIRFIADPLKIKHTKAKLYDVIYNETGLTRAKFNRDQINLLSISGGGANGAYGAGVLCGWTENGSRPEFDIVTVVSTGALIAPAAYIGSSYDSVIKDIYTNISDIDIMKQNLIDFFIGGRPSLLDTQPLRGVLKRVVTEKVLEDVAREHAGGRRLYIATTNIDARRMVIWDMGAIASYGTPEALELFRSVMLASASIPVAFPPVMLKVEAGGKPYSEMHVDGSVATQLFGSFLVMGRKEAIGKKTNIYVVRNGKIADVPEEVPQRIWDIAGASFSTLITWQSYGDIYRFAMLAKYERLNFYFTCIPYEFREPRKSEFDLAYMRKLFYRGYSIGQKGDQWLRQIGSVITTGAPDGGARKRK